MRTRCGGSGCGCCCGCTRPLADSPGGARTAAKTGGALRAGAAGDAAESGWEEALDGVHAGCDRAGDCASTAGRSSALVEADECKG